MFFKARSLQWLYIIELFAIFLNFLVGHEVVVLPYLPLGSGVHKIECSVFLATIPVLALGVTARWEFLSIEILSSKVRTLKLNLAIQIIQGFLVFGLIATFGPTFGNRFFGSYCLMFSALMLALLLRLKTNFWIYPLVVLMVAITIPGRVYKLLGLNFLGQIVSARGNVDFPLVLAFSGLFLWLLVVSRRPVSSI